MEIGRGKCVKAHPFYKERGGGVRRRGTISYSQQPSTHTATGADKKVSFEGQGASIDPRHGLITEALKREFGCYIILNTNGIKLPNLSHTDEVVMSLKAVTPDIYRAYTLRLNRKLVGNFAMPYRHGDYCRLKHRLPKQKDKGAKVSDSVW